MGEWLLALKGALYSFRTLSDLLDFLGQQPEQPTGICRVSQFAAYGHPGDPKPWPAKKDATWSMTSQQLQVTRRVTPAASPAQPSTAGGAKP